MSFDLELLRDAPRDRMGDVLLGEGAKVAGSSARGRATCPAHGGDGLNVSYGNGLATCHSGCGGKTYDALGLVAAVEGLDLRNPDDLRAAAHRLAEILGVRIEDDGGPVPGTRRAVGAHPAPKATPTPSRDVAALVAALRDRDEEGETCLLDRGLLSHRLPEFVRFNRGSADEWLAARERDGFVLAFLAHRGDGTLATISLRNIRPEGPPAPWKKTIALKGASTSGAAICRPEIRFLAEGDPEFASDELVVVEGGTDALAVTIAFDLGALEGVVAPAWALGAIGCGSAPATIRAFAPVVRGRTVHVALDLDAPGEDAVPKTIAAAWEAGAARVTRLRPPTGKDFADAWRANG
ncbi:MAG: hypothetical protein ACYC4P_11650 [Thermoanaerobaculia bacterium]